VVCLVTTLPQIFHRIQQWKNINYMLLNYMGPNFENRSIYGKDMDKILWLTFLGHPVYCRMSYCSVLCMSCFLRTNKWRRKRIKNTVIRWIYYILGTLLLVEFILYSFCVNLFSLSSAFVVADKKSITIHFPHWLSPRMHDHNLVVISSFIFLRHVYIAFGQ